MKIVFTSFLSMLLLCLSAQKQVSVLQVPGVADFCKIDEKGKSVLPSGRYVSPAGELIRITNDPFGLKISPDGKKAITIHDGVFTLIDIATLQATRVPSYDKKLYLLFRMVPSWVWLLPPIQNRCF